MRRLFIDIETYSSVDLVASGVYPYVESEDFEIMLFAYAWDDDAVQCVKLAEGEKLPRDVVEALVSEDVEKHAYNAMFERVCIGEWLKRIRLSENTVTVIDDDFRCDVSCKMRSFMTNKLPFYERNLTSSFDILGQPEVLRFLSKAGNCLVETPISSWYCTQVHAYIAGYSGSLDAVGRAMGLPDDKKKLAHGKALVRYFGRPCVRAGANGGRVRNLPHHDSKKWKEYIEYCKRDVEAEREIFRRLEHYKIPPVERDVYELDQEINDCGVLIDGEMVERAIDCSERHKERCMVRAREITGLGNPNSVAQMKRYIKEREGIDIVSLRKGDINELMGRAMHDDTREVLCLRGELAKTSVKKYRAMQKCMRKDGRAGGLLQHYGASRTGRWAGRLVQVQNLPRNKMTGIHDARKMLRGGDYEAIDILYPSVQDTLSQLVRTAFVAREGCTFAVVDFSAIEARVIAWLSGEAWRMEVFRTHGKIYEASASAMFSVDIDRVTKGSVLRQKGKIAELALGYGGGVGALKTMGAIGMGLAEDELQSLVDSWRSANPSYSSIVAMP